MKEIDIFATELFEEAKRFLEKAKEATDNEGQKAFLHAALLLGISSLEAHINAVSQEMSERSDLSAVENSVLLEKDFVFDDGEFKLANRLKMYNLTDRILFISKHFALKGKKIDTSAVWWSQLHQGIDERNSLVHPKEKHTITYKKVKSTFEGIIGVLDEIYMMLYNSHFPALGRQIDSKMSF
jgi:hypothetical protein